MIGKIWESSHNLLDPAAECTIGSIEKGKAIEAAALNKCFASTFYSHFP